MNILYKTSATSTGGRDGRAVSADNKLEVKLAAPRELGGTGAEGTTGYMPSLASAIVGSAQHRAASHWPPVI